MESVQERTASYVRQLRVAHGLKQQQLADSLGIKRTSVSNIENGKQAITLELFCKIASALNESPGVLLSKILSDAKTNHLVNPEDVGDPGIRMFIKNVISENE